MEIWKDVPEYEGKYQVSNMGNVKSLNYKKTGKTRVLKQGKDKDGYPYVNLSKDGKTEFKKVHRLVAEAFIPNPLNLPQVNHKSECPMLNFSCCLEWCTAKYNSNYGTRTRRSADSQSKPIDQLDKDGQFIRRWKSAKEAGQQTGVQISHITKCAKGKQHYNTAGGYKWRYAS